MDLDELGFFVFMDEQEQEQQAAQQQQLKPQIKYNNRSDKENENN